MRGITQYSGEKRPFRTALKFIKQNTKQAKNLNWNLSLENKPLQSLMVSGFESFIPSLVFSIKLEALFIRAPKKMKLRRKAK